MAHYFWFSYAPHGMLLEHTFKTWCFFTDEYPSYVMESKSCEVEDLEIMYVTSLLMLHCVLVSQNRNILQRTCINWMMKRKFTSRTSLKKSCSMMII
jgi:hypothetical protein